MRNLKSLVLLSSLYLITVLLGLNTAVYILPLMYPEGGGEPVIPPVVSEPQSVGSAAELFAYIIVATAVMLLLMRGRLGFIVNAALFLSFFSGSFITFAAFFGDFAIFLTLLLIALSVWRKDDPLVSNMVLVFTLSGVGALLGASLGIAPVVALVVLVSVYDFVAVFVTKHMVTLARESKGRYNMMFLIPVGDRIMGLGAGDVALPTTFAVSVLAAHGAGYAITVAFGGLLGVVSLFYYLLEREGATLPALPPITAGLLAGYGLCLLALG